MQASLLIIEDEEELAELVALYLNREGIRTIICLTAETGLEACRNGGFDLILLDINLPGMDGFEFLQILRRESTIPVMIVSAREADEDLVLGLGIGADEFVIKPFSPKVLVARVRALLRRVRQSPPTKDVVAFGPFTLDREGYLLKRGDKKVLLSTKEFEVLRYLVDHAGRTLPPEAIYRGIWMNQSGELSTIAVYVQRLRRKLEENPSEPLYIQTVFGKGYRFNRQQLKEETAE